MRIGGHRNFGYGKRMGWAGKNALADRYGRGHFATRAAHAERWGQFVAFARESAGVRDARQVTAELIADYCRHLAQQVESGAMKVAYAQNLLSSVNVVLETMRQDRTLRISPASFVGRRTSVRQAAPAGLDRGRVDAAVDHLRDKGEDRVAAAAALARDFGLRFREASLLDVRIAIRDARTGGRINVTEGTKGGRGHSVDRWVPVSTRGLETLEAAGKVVAGSRNLIPANQSFAAWRDHADAVWRSVATGNDLSGFHDLRAAYACERYAELTGQPAPVVAGHRTTTREDDRAARAVIAEELGHGRIDVLGAYVGSAR